MSGKLVSMVAGVLLFIGCDSPTHNLTSPYTFGRFDIEQDCSVDNFSSGYFEVSSSDGAPYTARVDGHRLYLSRTAGGFTREIVDYSNLELQGTVCCDLEGAETVLSAQQSIVHFYAGSVDITTKEGGAYKVPALSPPNQVDFDCTK